MSKGRHAVVPVCGECGQPVVADYDGEIWHEADKSAADAEFEAYARAHGWLRDPEHTVEPLSFNEMRANYLLTGQRPAEPEDPLDPPKVFANDA